MEGFDWIDLLGGMTEEEKARVREAAERAEEVRTETLRIIREFREMRRNGSALTEMRVWLETQHRSQEERFLAKYGYELNNGHMFTSLFYECDHDTNMEIPENGQNIPL